MNLSILEEPELEFGGGGRHVDIRFGIKDYNFLGTATTVVDTVSGVVDQVVDRVEQHVDGTVDAVFGLTRR